MKRHGRCRMPRTPRWYFLLPASNLSLNQSRKRPTGPLPCSMWPPFLIGLSMVAHSAGVSTIATITDSAIAVTIVAVNCR